MYNPYKTTKIPGNTPFIATGLADFYQKRNYIS